MSSTGIAWKAFWDRGGWWKAALLVAAYWGIYELLGLLCSTVFASFIDAENPVSNVSSVFFGVALPILLAGGLLVLFTWSVGWLREMFARQPVKGRPWMWVAVVLVIVPIILRLIGTNWSAYSVTLVLAILFLGLCVGFTEELATRGLAVTIIRKGGHGERTVFVLSSLLFALLHAGNLVAGQAPLVVAITVVYTFGFGAMMYLSLRATGRLVWVMLLHAATDPTTILAAGGIDAHSDTTGSTSGLISFAGLFNYVYILLALVAIFLVRNREDAKAAPVIERG
ncbi:MAG: CPBP family intramembrane glutamic endopeptidase [Microbacterium sp.]